jgi:hypothetical protein
MKTFYSILKGKTEIYREDNANAGISRCGNLPKD